MSEQPVNPASHETKESTSVDFEALNSGKKELLRLYTLINPTAAEQWLKNAIEESANGKHPIDEFIYGAEQTLAAELAAAPANDTAEPESGNEAPVDVPEDTLGLHEAAMALKPRLKEISDLADKMRKESDPNGPGGVLSYAKSIRLAGKKLGFDKDKLSGIQVYDAYKQAQNILRQEHEEEKPTRAAAKTQRTSERAQNAQYIDDVASAIIGDKVAFRKIERAVRTSRANYRKTHTAEEMRAWPQSDAVLEALRALVEDGSTASIDTELLEKIDSHIALASWKHAQAVHRAQADTGSARALEPADTETAKAIGNKTPTAHTRALEAGRRAKGPTDLNPRFVNRVSPGGYLGDDDDYEIRQDAYRQSVEDPKAAALKENAVATGRIDSGIAFAKQFIEVARKNDEAEKRDIMSSLPRNGADIHELSSAAPFDERFGKVLEFYQGRLKTLKDEKVQKLEQRENIKDGTESVSDTEPKEEGLGAPTEPEGEKQAEYDPLVLAFIDQTHDALAAARDAAETRRRNELQQDSRFKQFLKNVWMGENGLAGSYYLEKFKKESLSQIQQNGDVLTYESADLGARTDAQLATIERFQSEYDESIHTDAGEQRVELGADSEFTLAMKDLLRRYASGEITDPEALQEERGRILERLNGAGNKELVGEGKVRIDNLLAIADQVKAMVGHGESLDRVLDGMKLYSAESRSNVRSEAHLDKVERLVDRLQKSRVGSLVGPETIGIAAAVSLGVARAGRGTVLHVLGVTVAPGVLGGAFAAIRESKRLKQERALHSREMAQGKSYDTGKRRDAIESTRYETVDAGALTAQLEELLRDSDSTPDDVQRAYEIIAGVEARIQLSDKRNVDLVSYSSPLTIEKERRGLDEARALVKQRLTDHMGELTNEYRTQFGISDGQSTNESLSRYTDAVMELDTDIDAKDKAYRKLRRRRVAKAAVIGAGTSLVLGLGSQELIAFVNPSYDGLAEHMLHGGAPSSDGRQTLLEGLVHGHSGGTGVEHIAPSATYASYSLGTHQNALELPSDYKVVTGQGGMLSIEGPKGTQVVDNLTLQKDGALTSHSVELLKEHNISVVDTGHVVTHDVAITKNLTVAEYNHTHAADTTHITRDFGYNNNTAAADKNELGLQWGHGGTGVGANGDVQMSVSHMTQAGSSHGFEHTSWSHDAHDGKLKLAISGSRGTQAQAYLVDVKPNGTIDIPKDSPAAKFFSIDKSGHAEFHGAYAEVAEVRGEVGGVTHIAPLATVVGSNSVTHLSDTVTTTTREYIPHVKVTPPAIDTVRTAPARTIEGFGMPGFVPRRPLEKLSRRRVDGAGEYGHGRRRPGEYGLYHQLAERSPTIEADPGATLVLGKELDWFKDQLARTEQSSYIQKINDDIKNSSQLQSLPSTLRTLTTQPVAAASESENIYKTLSLYAQQDAEQLRNNTILLNVNWLDEVERDPENRVKIDKTIAEIERARHDFPQLSIATMTREYKVKEVEKTGGVIGYAARDLMNTALMAIHQNIENGRLAYDDDIAIVRHDADMRGMARHYFRQLERSMDDNPGVDIFHGTIRSDVRMHDRYPGIGIVTNFSQAMSMGNAAANRPWTVGINAVVRASSLAAVGGLGPLLWTGAGSDDSNLTYRISDARNAPTPTSSGASPQPEVKKHRIVVPVVGMGVDSAADRLIPQYLMDRHFGAAWDTRMSQGTSFSSGPGGYRDRTADNSVMDKNRRENVNEHALYERIEVNMGAELSNADPAVARRVLSIFFAGVPNAYVIRGEIGSGPVAFELTTRGRKFIKQRIIKEANGSSGAGYGARKMRQIYGRRMGGRNTAAKESPYVAPKD